MKNYKENIMREEKKKIEEKIFDNIIITVSNQYQKEYLNKQILQKKYIIPADTKCEIVVEKKKLGSGGAILNIIKNIDTKSKKILLINSAGKCKRMPLYADKGKICIPSFINEDSILLEEILNEASKIGKKIEDGILIVSGDCITQFEELDKNIYQNNTAFIVLADEKYGEKHGVFVTENKKLKKALQKESKEVLNSENAVDKNGNVKIDTGIIYFNQNTINSLRKIKFDDNIILNAYTDFVYPLALEKSFDEYLKQKTENTGILKIIEKRKEIWNALENQTLDIEELHNGKFIHYGTVREFLEIASRKYEKDNIVINSIIYGKLSKGCYIENSTILNNCKVGENSIILDSIVDLDVPKNILVKTIEHLDGYYTIVLENSKENESILDIKIKEISKDKKEACQKALRAYKKKKDSEE